jgi:signal transduction histidine kinase/CheY-like chemotaxis protein
LKTQDDAASAIDASLSYTPYQLTLAGIVLPIQIHWVMNAIAGLCLGLIGAPRLGAVWALVSCIADWRLQRTYRGWQAVAGEVDSRFGLRRLATLIGLRTLLWVSASAAFTLTRHSYLGLAQTAVTALGLVAVAVSSGWTSRSVLAANAAPSILALAVEAVALFPPLPAAGLIIGLGVFAATLGLIAIGTHKAVGEWSKSHAKMLRAMRDLTQTLRQSEAVEHRLGIAVGIADLYVYEVDYHAGTFVAQGDGTGLFNAPPTFEQMRDDPFATVHPDDRAAVAEAWRLAEAAGEPFRLEYRTNLPGDADVWVYAVAELTRDADGLPVSLVGALQNITARKAGELSLMRARDAAEAASKAKSDFLANMSHEIRTPLNGVLGMVQAMRRGELEDLQRSRLEVIRESGETLLSILNDILDIAKIESGKLELEVGEFDVSEVVRKALGPFTALAMEKQVELSTEVAPEARGVYLGDPTRVGQILHNLVSNAVKFTESGAVTVAIDYADSRLVLRVSDTGVGFDMARAETLFESFRQADTSVTRRFGGTGLGLAIASELARRMAGAISVASEPGRGSVFTVTLALSRLRDASVGGDLADEEEGEPIAALPPLRVLAAEDNGINQLVLKTLLNQVGVDPTVVEDGRLAVASWEAGEWDLILLDVQMPNMDGPTAARLIREKERASGRRRTPIVALTANVMEHQLDAYRAVGIDSVVAKPIEAARLFEAIEESLCAGGVESAVA